VELQSIIAKTVAPISNCRVEIMGIGSSVNALFLNQLVFGPGSFYHHVDSNTIHKMLEDFKEMLDTAQSITVRQVQLQIIDQGLTVDRVENKYPHSVVIQGSAVAIFTVHLGELAAGEAVELFLYMKPASKGTLGFEVQAETSGSWNNQSSLESASNSTFAPQISILPTQQISFPSNKPLEESDRSKLVEAYVRNVLSEAQQRAADQVALDPSQAQETLRACKADLELVGASSACIRQVEKQIAAVAVANGNAVPALIEGGAENRKPTKNSKPIGPIVVASDPQFSELMDAQRKRAEGNIKSTTTVSPIVNISAASETNSREVNQQDFRLNLRSTPRGSHKQNPPQLGASEPSELEKKLETFRKRAESEVKQISNLPSSSPASVPLP
jgi:hypothetical protein